MAVVPEDLDRGGPARIVDGFDDPAQQRHPFVAGYEGPQLRHGIGSLLQRGAGDDAIQKVLENAGSLHRRLVDLRRSLGRDLGGSR